MPARPSPAPAASSHGRSATNARYAYRAKASQSHASNRSEHAKLARALAAHRQFLSHASSAVRSLRSARNELIAQAIVDGLTISHVSATTGENMRAVRSITLAYDDLHPSELPHHAHLSALQAKSGELGEAESHRQMLLERREALILTALRSRVFDDLELASLTGLTPDYIQRAARGNTRSS